MKDLILILFLSSCFVSQINSYELELEKIRADILENHNYHRKRHQVNELVRDLEIEKVAQTYSEYLASINQMKHSGGKYGENLYYCWSTSGMCLDGKEASQRWYDEVSQYDFNNPGFSSKTGHFTQLVWKGSKRIGCGANCNNKNACYVTCNYYPPGNYLGQFSVNVFPLKVEEPKEEEVNKTDEKEKNDQSVTPNKKGKENAEDSIRIPENGAKMAEKFFLVILTLLLII